MDFFIPKDCSIDLVTPYWLLAALALLTVAGVALLAQVVMLWRREVRAGVARWGRLPLALPILWAIVCGLCFLAADLGVETQFTLVVAAVMVGMGWFALSRFARRIERA
jgi:hypothetical protein